LCVESYFKLIILQTHALFSSVLFSYAVGCSYSWYACSTFSLYAHYTFKSTVKITLAPRHSHLLNLVIEVCFIENRSLNTWLNVPAIDRSVNNYISWYRLYINSNWQRCQNYHFQDILRLNLPIKHEQCRMQQYILARL
jgi:hypothetical protein